MSSVTSKHCPLVSTRFLLAKKNKSRQKNEKIKNVTAIPNSSRRIGNKRFTNQSDTHMVIIQTDNAVPRIWVGNISVETTNFNGPSEKEKNKRKRIIQPSINHPLMF